MARRAPATRRNRPADRRRPCRRSSPRAAARHRRCGHRGDRRRHGRLLARRAAKDAPSSPVTASSPTTAATPCGAPTASSNAMARHRVLRTLDPRRARRRRRHGRHDPDAVEALRRRQRARRGGLGEHRRDDRVPARPGGHRDPRDRRHRRRHRPGCRRGVAASPAITTAACGCGTRVATTTALSPGAHVRWAG